MIKSSDLAVGLQVRVDAPGHPDHGTTGTIVRVARGPHDPEAAEVQVDGEATKITVHRYALCRVGEQA